MVSLEQPVRGSAAYEKNDQIRPAALLVKEFADAAKYKAQAGKVKAQAEQDKAQAEQEKAQTGQSSQEESQLDGKIVRLNNSRGCTQAFSSSANMPVNISSGNS